MTVQNNLINITMNYGLSQMVLEPTRLDNTLHYQLCLYKGHDVMIKKEIMYC